MPGQWEVWLLAIALAAAPLGGCLGESNGPARSSPPRSGTQVGSNTSEGVRTLAQASGTVDALGLATYDGVDPGDVEPYVPGNMTPVSCFPPNASDTVDVTLVFGQRSYEGVPDGGEPVPQVGLLGCAKRPAGLDRGAANEVAWVDLLGWVDNDAFADFLSSIGFPSPQADIAVQTIPRGYTFAATRNGTPIVEARFLTSPVGLPAGGFATCEPAELNGRSIGEAPDGSLVAVDWNKTEAVCPAEASITWPAQSPLADVLGPAREPTVVIDTRVEEAQYWWRVLPDPGSTG